jgi:hypothetical protein
MPTPIADQQPITDATLSVASTTTSVVDEALSEKELWVYGIQRCMDLNVAQCAALQAYRPINKHKSRKKYCKVNKKRTKCKGRLNGKYKPGEPFPTT